MARLYIHYEAAFEDFVRSRGWPYLPVDEQKRAIFAGARIKSFDFLVYPPGGHAWLVDVKGRKFPYEVNGGRRYWENWVTREDLEGLGRWKAVFGESFEPMLVFVYWLTENGTYFEGTDVHLYRGRYYSYQCISATRYAQICRQRSPRWDTVCVPIRMFRELVQPIDRLLKSVG